MARIVLVHGAFGGAWCWEPVLPGLRARGHTVETFDLPGAGSDRTPAERVSLAGYADRACEVLASGPPAVLAGHSMGGMVITQAAALAPAQVVKLIYVAAFLPAPGQSLMDLTHLPEAEGDQVQANLIVEGDPPVATMRLEACREALYACCTDAQVAWALARRGPQPVLPFTQPVVLDPERAAEFTALPRAYVQTTEDRAIRPALQRRMLTAAGCEPVLRIDTDHSPWLSRTDELVEVLDRLAR